MKFNPGNTAISRKTISTPLKAILDRKYILDKKYHRVLDYGCGRGKDVSWLKENGYRATGWDKYHGGVKPGPQERFDVVLCSYVLNVIAKPKERLEVILDAWNYVAPGGFLMLSTRTVKEIVSEAKKKKWKKFGDGFISSEARQTFQRGFTGNELSELVRVLEEVGHVESYSGSDFSYVLVSKKSEGR